MEEPPAPQTTPIKRKAAYWKQPISAKASKLSLLSISDDERSDQPRSHEPSIGTEIPSPTRAPPLTFLEWSRPTTIISVSAYSVKVLTVYRGKPPSQTKSDLTASPEKPLPHTKKPRSKPIILDRIENKAKNKGVGNGDSKPVKLPFKVASMSSGVLARETAKELHQAQEEFLQIKQLIKRAEPPPKVCW